MKPIHALALLGLAGLAGATAMAAVPEPAVVAPGVISTGEYESHAAFSPDGEPIYFLKNTADISPDCTVLIFMAARKGGQGSRDFWVSYLRDGAWPLVRVS